MFNLNIADSNRNKLGVIVFNRYGIYYWNATKVIWSITA